MSLSLDIIVIARAFALLVAGAASRRPSSEGDWAGPGSESRAKAQDGSPRNPGDPTLATRNVRRARGTRSGQAHEELSRLMGANWEIRVGLDSEIISGRVQSVGSRSARIRPMTPGNLAPEDPAEERRAPRWQNRVWEPRRAYQGP